MTNPCNRINEYFKTGFEKAAYSMAGKSENIRSGQRAMSAPDSITANVVTQPPSKPLPLPTVAPHAVNKLHHPKL